MTFLVKYCIQGWGWRWHKRPRLDRRKFQHVIQHMQNTENKANFPLSWDVKKLKSFRLQGWGASSLTPNEGLCPWTLLETCTPPS